MRLMRQNLELPIDITVCIKRCHYIWGRSRRRTLSEHNLIITLYYELLAGPVNVIRPISILQNMCSHGSQISDQHGNQSTDQILLLNK